MYFALVGARRVLSTSALALCLIVGYGCHTKSSGLPTCPAGDDYDTDACGCKPVAGASLGATPGKDDASSAHMSTQTNPEPDAYPCGDGATCDSHTQTCEHVLGGAPPGVDRYSCITLPAACVSELSCVCLTSALRGRGASSCSGEGRHLTVRIDVP